MAAAKKQTGSKRMTGTKHQAASTKRTTQHTGKDPLKVKAGKLGGKATASKRSTGTSPASSKRSSTKIGGRKRAMG